MLEFLSVALMLVYVFTGKRVIGFAGWFLFGISWLVKVQYYMGISDYYNVTIMVGAFSIFTFIGLTILKSKNDGIFKSATSVAAVSSLVYFVFALTPLGFALISHTSDMTVRFAHFIGFDFYRQSYELIEYNGRYVEIILACTGIESMALFTGIAVSTSADLKRRAKAFLVSVPVIYILNLLRNIFIVAAFGDGWFGAPDYSFYIAHHVISKILATLALILISLGVFRFLPEFADLIFSLKEEVVKTWSGQD